MNFQRYAEKRLDEALLARDRLAAMGRRRESWKAAGLAEAWADALSYYTNKPMREVYRLAQIRLLQREAAA